MDNPICSPFIWFGPSWVGAEEQLKNHVGSMADDRFDGTNRKSVKSGINKSGPPL